MKRLMTFVVALVVCLFFIVFFGVDSKAHTIKTAEGLKLVLLGKIKTNKRVKSSEKFDPKNTTTNSLKTLRK